MFSKAPRGVGIDDSKTNGTLSVKGSRIRSTSSILKKSDNISLNRTGSATNDVFNNSKNNKGKTITPPNKSVTIIDNIKDSKTKSLTNISIPKCSHSTKQIEDYTFLHDVYVQNLQQQIQLLEMENNYLKKSQNIKEFEKEKEDLNKIKNDNFKQEIAKCESPKKLNIVDNKFHIFDDDEISLIIRDDNIKKESYQQSPKQQFSTHPIFQKTNFKTANETKLETKIYKLESKLSQKNAEINELMRLRAELEEKLWELSENIAKKDEISSRNRNVLVDENIVLQKRLDDLTPILSQKESIISRLEAEKDSLIIRLKSAKQECKGLQLKYDEKEKEKLTIDELENRRKQEIERLVEKIKEFDNENAQLKINEQSYIDQLSLLKRKMKEEELKNKKEKSLSDKILDDNNNLIKENSQLSSDIIKLQMIIEQQDKELSKIREFEIQEQEFMESRQRELNLRNELRIKEEYLTEIKEKLKNIENQLKEKEIQEEKQNDEKQRIQNELEGLNILSKALSSDNKTLRENKNSLEDKIQILEKKITDKEVEIEKLKDEKDNMKLRHYEAIEKMRKEIFLHSEKTNEFEALVKKIKDLSDTAVKLQSREASTIRSISILSPNVSYDSEQKPQSRSIYSLKEYSNISEESTNNSLNEKINTFSEMLKYKN
uniref:Lebercilin domain-containing protein n=1 Tax=Strongyloides stercoralis TaxID=6248 RepID=A0A0K0DYM4_STRER